MRPILLGVLLSLSAVAFGQNPLKSHSDKPFVEPKPIVPARPIIANQQPSRQSESLNLLPLQSIGRHTAIANEQITMNGSRWLDLHPNDVWKNRNALSQTLKELFSMGELPTPFYMDWIETAASIDVNEVEHIRAQQILMNAPIKGQELILHVRRGHLESMNGYVWTGPLPNKLPAPMPAEQALTAAREYLIKQEVKFTSAPSLQGLHFANDETQLIWIPVSGKLVLAYKAAMHPNALDHWTVYVNASTGEIMQAISETCSFSVDHLFTNAEHSEENCDSDFAQSTHFAQTAHLLLDGATTTSDQDLLGQNRTVNGYQVGSTFYMIDASRNGMYEPTQSVMPDEPLGVIWTIDAQNSSPQQDNFGVFHVSNTNNNWQALEVSAHFNAGQSYEYFLAKYGRNSINGSGGNIVSIINVTDENDNNMDNAFWNGSAMFYGNGNSSFKQLARGLDVAGHEMSHGVIQNTANLEYIGQSGALNESYADVFGAMIDRNDWQMGEDVVQPAVFPSGALRDLSNPHNGGNQFGDRGWQPAHMNEFVNLPNTPEGDNGGVHVNSGIPNRAFFLLATSVGKEKAEQIWYKALRDYLVKSSQFVDMRLAAEKAATDLHGGSSPELDAVRNAFNTVGIGGGQGGDYEEDIEISDGDDFIIATDESNSDLYFIPPGNPDQFVKMNVPEPISRPSFTDDGASCVYIDKSQNMILINFNWAAGLSYQVFNLETNPQGIWRNIVTSKDGSKVAYTTANLINEIYVFNFPTNGTQTFELYNPTTAPGGFGTGDVLYADAMEWDYSGEYIMYDALNRIESNFGDGIEYWDINFLEAWNKGTNSFGEGIISKLFASLPENVSVGNPSFAKNSPYIITFDFIESYFDIFGSPQTDYWVIAANIEAGTANNIFQNTTVGYPSYSRLDDKILFTYDDFGDFLLATIDIQAADKTLPVVGSEVSLITGAQQGVWFLTGLRDFTATQDISNLYFDVNPQPATDQLVVRLAETGNQMAYTIFDLTGKAMLQGEKSDGTIEIQALPQGAYIIECTLDGKTGRKVVVKQ